MTRIQRVKISLGGRDNVHIQRVVEATWPQMVKFFSKDPPRTDDKASVGWYSFAEFEPAYRDSENFKARHALTFDYDHVTWEQITEVFEAIKMLGHAAFAYTTWSHTPEKPRWRVLLPLSRPVGYDEFQAVSRFAAQTLGGIELPARESHVPAQYMFLPAAKPNGEFLVQNFEGDPINGDSLLPQDWQDKSTWPHRADGDGVHTKDTITSPLEKQGVIGDFCRSFSITAAIERFKLPYKPGSTEGRWTFIHGSRPDGAVIYDSDSKIHIHHDTSPARGQQNAFDLVRLHLYGELDKGHEDKPITERPSFKAMVALAREQPECQAASAATEFQPVQDEAGSDGQRVDAVVPAIRFNLTAPVQSGIKSALKVVEAIAASSKLVVYTNRLMRVIETNDREGFGQVTVPTIELQSVDAASLPALLVGHCTFEVARKDGGWMQVDCPPTLAKAITTKATDMRRAYVKRIVCTPILVNGQLVATPGFSADHEAWIAAPQGVALEEPTYEAAKAALARLETWLAEFPFVDAEDRSVALAALLTAAMRASLPTTPGIVVSKPQFGSGASTLCNIINVVLTGKPAAVVNFERGGEELDKHIGSNLLAGLPSVVIDNIPDGSVFNSRILAQVVSERTAQVRRLGQSVVVDVPCTQLALLNGNNVTVTEDLVRRFMRIDLNPHCEDPHRRRFKRPNLVEEAQEARAQILSDIYTIVEAFRQSGSAVGTEIDLSGYTAWIEAVVRPLVWLGYPNPILSQKKLERGDPKKAQWQGILSAWLEVFGETAVTARDLLEEEFPSETTSAARARLQRLVSEMCERNGYRGGNLGTSFGNRLRAIKDRVMHGMVVESAGERDHVALWRARRAEQSWLD